MVTEEEAPIILTTRNYKPLFANRTLQEIHDELSHIAAKAVTKNEKIQYDENDLKLEASYDAPDGSGTWKFCLMKDTFDFVRTATELSNCVAGTHYFKEAQRKSKYLMYMQNELGEKVACIEVYNRYNGLKMGQFQSHHDTSLPERYASIAKQWMEDKNIDYKNNHDVELFGSGKAIYGNGNADFHSDEVDEVEQTIISKDTKQKITQQRYNKAVQVYGLDANGNLNLPTAPNF